MILLALLDALPEEGITSRRFLSRKIDHVFSLFLRGKSGA